MSRDFRNRLIGEDRSRMSSVIMSFFSMFWITKEELPSCKFERLIIARNQGHFEPANNYQRYIVLHSWTIEYQEIQYGGDQNFDLLFAQDCWICIQRLTYFYSEKELRTNLVLSKIIKRYGRRFQDQRSSCLTISHSLPNGVSSLTQHGK